jgi:hypothetical protein
MKEENEDEGIKTYFLGIIKLHACYIPPHSSDYISFDYSYIIG